MQKSIICLLIGAVVGIIASVQAFPQEVTMMQDPRAQPAALGMPMPMEGNDNEGENENEGNDEVQDEAELANALGVDRNSLYEDLMRIQEELGGSTMGPYGGGGGGTEQNPENSQEQEPDY